MIHSLGGAYLILSLKVCYKLMSVYKGGGVPKMIKLVAQQGALHCV